MILANKNRFYPPHRQSSPGIEQLPTTNSHYAGLSLRSVPAHRAMKGPSRPFPKWLDLDFGMKDWRQ